MRLRRFALFVAIYALVVMAAGAVSWQIHAGAGFGLVALTVGLAVLCWREEQQGLRWAGLVAAGAAGLECVPGVPMIHACFAPVLFAAVATVALGIPETAPDTHGARGLRVVVTMLPVLVFLQIAMGAAYRHKLSGVMPHMGSAVIVAGMILGACVIILQRYPLQQSLRRAALGAIAIVLLQVSVGITVFIMRLLDMDNSAALAVTAAAHICGAALMLVATTRLSLA